MKDQARRALDARVDGVRVWATREAERTWLRCLMTMGALFSQRRVFGLSAEAAFWATFTLPWLVLGVLTSTAGVANFFGDDATNEVRADTIAATSTVLNQQAMSDYMEPLIDSVLKGSTGLSLLGMLVALWSGSRIFATFVEGSLILAGRPNYNYFRTRGIALVIYALGLVVMAIMAVSIFSFPDVWSTMLGIAPGPNVAWAMATGFVFMCLTLTTVLFIADPFRVHWIKYLPGGCLSVCVWLLASWGLQIYLRWWFQEGSIYGAVAAPIAVMLWVFVSVLAVFIGMTFNAAIELTRAGKGAAFGEGFERPGTASGDLPL